MKRALTVLTHSELSTLRDCPQRWQFAYLDRLRPMAQSQALATGSAVHEGLEAGYRTQLEQLLAGEQPVLEVIIQRSYAAAMTYYTLWLERIVDLPIDQRERLEEESRHVPELLSWALPHYWRRNERELETLIPLDIEMAFAVPIRDEHGRRINRVEYRGVIDLIAYDRLSQDIVVIDHKTTSGDITSLDKRIELDPQMAGYLWAVRQIIADGKASSFEGLAALTDEEKARLSDGACPTGRVAYNVIRTKAPRAVELTQKGVVSSAAIDTTAELYEAALAVQEARGVARTEAQVSRLDQLRARGDGYYARREYWRSERDVDRWRREVVADAKRHKRLIKHPEEITRNASSCTSAGSYPCAYRALCLEPESQELRATFRQTSSKHEEVVAAAKTDSDTQTWGF